MLWSVFTFISSEWCETKFKNIVILSSESGTQVRNYSCRRLVSLCQVLSASLRDSHTNKPKGHGKVSGNSCHGLTSGLRPCSITFGPPSSYSGKIQNNHQKEIWPTEKRRGYTNQPSTHRHTPALTTTGIDIRNPFTWVYIMARRHSITRSRSRLGQPYPQDICRGK